MNGLRIVRCTLGRHRGTWSLPGSRCESRRTCESCGRTEERITHGWLPYACTEAHRCGQVRRCERCGATETRLAHEWGPWTYLSNQLGSPQIRRCRRCHESERTVYTLR